MAKRDITKSWKARFEHTASTAANPDKWHYTRMSMESATEAFNGLGLLGYQLVVKDAVWREQVGRYVKKGKHPGIYFRVVRL